MAPAPAAAPVAPAEEVKPESVFDEALIDDTAAGRQIGRAMKLERERSELQARIASNRDYLRLMDKNEELSNDQGAWLDAFYPQKEKGTRRDKDDVERTRLIKAAARKAKNDD